MRRHWPAALALHSLGPQSGSLVPTERPAGATESTYGVNAVGVANGSGHAGTTASNRGTAAAHATPAASTQCRSAAERRRSRTRHRQRAEDDQGHLHRLPSFLALSTSSAMRSSSSSESFDAFAAEHGRDDLLGGPVEERVDQVPQRRLPRGAPRAPPGM